MKNVFVRSSWIINEASDGRHLHIFDPTKFQISNSPNSEILVQNVHDSYVNHPYKILYHFEPHSQTPNWWNTCKIIICSHRCISSNDNTRIIYYPFGFFYLNTHKYTDYILQRSFKMQFMNSNLLTKRKFCLFINSNGAAKERIHFCQELMKYKSIDCRGNVLNNCDKISHRYYTPEFINCIREYKFVICFENSDYDGYFTEKPMNAYLGDTIPIYWANKESQKYFNEQSMVLLKEFNQENIEKAIQKIIELDTNHDLYMETLAEPLLKNNEFPQEFTIDAIQEKIGNSIDSDT